MSNNCGCNQTDSGEMLLVKATPSSASTCGTGSATAGTEDCPKQEPEYDISLSDFLVPSESGLTNMTVCNGAIYTAGMWLQFLNPVVSLKVSAVNGNIISLINQCPNGSAVEENPDAGQVVSKNAKFVVSGEPDCMSDAEKAEFITDALASVEEICVPALETCSSTAVTYPVGRVESDPSNLSAGKCIKRIYGFFFNAGRMFLNQLGDTVGYGDMDYRPLVKHITGHGVYQRKNYSEADHLNANEQYLLSVTTEGENLIGPTYLTKFFHETVIENHGQLDPTTWPSITGVWEDDYNLNVYPEIDNLGDILDHYYVMCRLELGIYKISGVDAETIVAKINDLEIGRVMVGNDADEGQYNSITVPIKVMKSAHKLTLKLTPTATLNHYFKLSIDGIYH